MKTARYPIMIQESPSKLGRFQAVSPDFTGMVIEDDLNQLKKEAKYWMETRLKELQDKGLDYPTPTSLSQIHSKRNQMVTMIQVSFPES